MAQDVWKTTRPTKKEPIILDLNLTALFTVAIKYYWPCKAEYTQAVTHSIWNTVFDFMLSHYISKSYQK